MNYQLHVGLLHRQQIRQTLEALKLYGGLEEFIESKGWLDSLFSIKGITPDAMSYLDKLTVALRVESEARAAKRAKEEAERAETLKYGGILACLLVIFLIVAHLILS